ncbi:MAG: ArsR family transcriptional regulator [Rhodospirillales bacterium]|nr:MAG: ArsR family transcriptional regulator [Rhodospirillales bacterium]
MEYDPAALFAALADTTRLRCLMLLTQAPSLCVCELMDALEEPQPKLSKHLGVLREMGLVADERRAQWVHYSLKSDLPDWVQDIVQASLRAVQKRKPYANDAKRLKARLSGCDKAA